MSQAAPMCGFITNADERKLKAVPVIYADKPGRNRNMYPKKELIKAAEYYNKLVQVDPTYRYIFIKHPKDESEEWLGLLAGSIEELYFDEDDNMLKMDCTLLPTTWGQLVGWLLDHEYVVGTSIRGSADKLPSVYQLGDKEINILIRTDFKLEGVDFVVYPSFITTSATKDNVSEQTQTISPLNSHDFERVLESFSKDTGVNIQEIVEQEEKNMFEKNTNGSPENVEKLKLELELYKTKMENVKEKVSQLQEKEKSLQTIIDNLETKKQTSEQELNSKVRVVSDLEEKLNKVKEQYEAEAKQAEELEALLAQKKEELAKVEEAMRKRHKSAVVNCCGKTFDENNKPKIRVVSVEEDISESPWGDIDKDMIRKLVWLTGDKELANKVFGVVENWDGWTSFKYPVYQPITSSEDGYDVDFVLNKYGLAKALGYMQGKGSIGLDKEQKKHLVQFLYDKYNELQKQGLAKIPESLAEISKRLKVVEKVEFAEDSDELLTAVVESALLHGIVDIEGIDALAENEAIKLNLSKESLGEIVLSIMNGGESNVLESVDKSKIPSKEDIIAMLIGEGDSITDFAQKYNIDSPDNFADLFSDIDENDTEILGKFKDALYTYLKQVLQSPDDAIAVITPLFDLFDEYISNAGKERNSEEEPAESNEEGKENVEDKVEEKVEDKVEDKVEESMEENVEDKVENKDLENNKEDDKVFEQLKTFLEEHFDGVTIQDEEDAMETLKKLVSDYADIYSQLQKVEFERVKENRVRELIDLGVDQQIIDEELADIEDEETLDNVVDKLKAVLSSVKESKAKNAIDPLSLRKGTSAVKEEKASANNNESLFNKMMKMV